MSRDILEVLSDQLRRNFTDSTKLAGLGSAATMSISNTSLALNTHALMKPMDYEPIYGQSDILAWEALGRPSSNGQPFRIQEISDQLVAFGHEEALDKISVTNAVIGADDKQHYPLSVNISLKSAMSENFWLDLVELLGNRPPSGIIFEILEHPVQDEKASIAHLIELKKIGYRFALDDIGIGTEHEKRLKLLGGIADFIKIDGRLIREKLSDDPNALEAFITKLKTECPNAQIVAEHVQNFSDARTLFAMGVDGVQGQNLRAQHYHTFVNRGMNTPAEDIEFPLK